MMCGLVHGQKENSGPIAGHPFAYPEDEPREAFWTLLLSLSDLTVPTEEFFHTFREMDAAFCVHHAQEPNNLSRHPKVIESFRQVLESRLNSIDKI